MATGVYHKYNVLKFRMLEVAYNHRPNPITCREIADELGLPINNISARMRAYTQRKYHYFSRQRKRTYSGSYRYKITKHGVITYFQYLKRIKLGFDLNQNRRAPKHMTTFDGLKVIRFRTKDDLTLTPKQLAPYINTTRRGVEEFGISDDDIITVSGVNRQFSPTLHSLLKCGMSTS
jgi:hypothetical protein